ncbi:MAG: CPXCG motif-containing cysteine-rich protein [Pseudomonadota bacterium]
MGLTEERISCPYCGEQMTVLLNPEDVGVDYIEDCQVCCRPMVITVFDGGDGALWATVRSEDE